MEDQWRAPQDQWQSEGISRPTFFRKLRSGAYETKYISSPKGGGKGGQQLLVKSKNGVPAKPHTRINRGEPGCHVVTPFVNGIPEILRCAQDDKIVEALPSETTIAAPPAEIPTSGDGTASNLPVLFNPSIQARIANPKQQHIAYLRAAIIRAFEEEISKNHKLKTQVVSDFLSLYNSGILLPDVHKKIGPIGRATLYGWNKAKQESGIQGLIPQYGGYKNSKITDQEKFILLKILLHQNGLKIGSGILLAKEYMKDKGIPSLSSISTLRRFIDDFKTTHFGFWTREREGDKAFNDKCLPYVERDWRILEVGDLLVADGHRLNFDVINPYTGKKCRAAIVMFWDFKSLYPLGWEIMLEENIQCISSALRNAILTLGKVPKRLLIDNGKAFKAKVFNTDIELEDGMLFGMFATLGIHIHFAQPYNPQEKLEALWGMLNNWFERLFPSYRGNSLADKPPYLKRNEKDAQRRHNSYVPKIEEVTDMMFNWREFCVKQPVKSRDGLSRKEIFDQEKGPGVDLDELAYLMMAKEIKTVHRNGITWNGWHYYDESLFDHLRNKVVIRYTHTDYKQVYVYDFKGEFICIARPIEKANSVAWDSEVPADREAYQRVNAAKRKCRGKVLDLREILDEKTFEALSWKEIVKKDPNIVKAIEKKDSETRKAVNTSPFVEGVSYSQDETPPTRYKPHREWSGYFEHWERYDYHQEEDPAMLTQDDLEFIAWYKTTSEYEAIYGPKKHTRLLAVK